MPNLILDNTYIVTDSSATALTWPSGARVNNVVFYALNTNAVAEFLFAAGSPVIRFAILTQGAGTSIQPATFSVDMGQTLFKTAWIPSTLTACTAWINFA